MVIKYPNYRDELVELGRQDQKEIRNHYQKLKSLTSDKARETLNQKLKEHCHIRAERMMQILKIIKEPSISNIGIEGSEMVSVLALHSYYDEMKKV